MRHEIIGPTPRSRNDFDPLNFLEKVFGNDDEFIVLDSNNLDASWRKDIEDVNEGTEFHWEKFDESVRNIETQFHLDESDTCSANQANTEVHEKDLPKRLLIYTSKTLLARLSLNLKCSVDGTFKSSSKLWAQQFIMMSKSKGYWIPTCFGWLPDKSEISYKVFFLLLKKKMDELGLSTKIKSLLCDFELNILKSADSMLKVILHACFFHFKQCIQRRVDRNGFKKRYETDEFFMAFINQASGISHLPIADVEDGLKFIEDTFDFDDNDASTFKDDFLQYLKDFWINGPIPPKIWNVFGRSEDITNNAQEGFNAKFNRELRETHPSPGKFF